MSEPIVLPVRTAAVADTATITAGEAVLRVAKRVAECEEAIDNALIKACSLMAEIPLARMDANLAAEHGQEAIEELVGTLSGIATARRHAVLGHGKLDETRRTLGEPVVAAGLKWLRKPAFAELREFVRQRGAA